MRDKKSSFYSYKNKYFKKDLQDFPSGTEDMNPPDNAGDTGLIPGMGRSHTPWSSKTYVPQILSLCSRTWEP